MTLHDISLPISNGMWSYKPEWQNEVSTICSTESGDPSTAYRFSLCSNTGTYIETSQHKLKTSCHLEEFPLSRFVQKCTLVSIPHNSSQTAVSREDFILGADGFSILPDTALILATGWGTQHQKSNYISECPHLSEALVDLLITLRPNLIGFDTPIIDHPNQPYQAIAKLFQALPNLLILAPLLIDPEVIDAGHYKLICAPIKIPNVCVSLCRPILMEM